MIKILFSCLAIFLLSSCAEKTIRIGVPLVLTGPSSRIGVTARNGLELAADFINSSKRIRGYRLELVIVDDQDSPEAALAVSQSLYDAGIRFLVGHMSSRSGSLVIPWANRNEVLLISPTISSEEWSRQDDWFFRAIGSNALQGQALAEHALRAGLRQVSAVYEFSNRSYTKNVLDSFVGHFESGGGKVRVTEPFTQGSGFDVTSLVSGLLADEPDALVCIASAIDVARICQELHLRNRDVPVYSGMWATTDDLYRNGGKAVENVVAVGTLASDSVSEAFLAFKKNYQAAYGEAPSFASMHAYESLVMLASALDQVVRSGKRPQPAAVKGALLSIAAFPGLYGELTIDQFGDCSRPYLTLMVKDGLFRLSE